MTPQEALTHLRNWYRKDKTGDVDSGACVVAFEALEKQIPKKALKLINDKDLKIGAGIWKAGVPVYACPNCKSFISRSSRYCSNCGQAIDRSE